MGEQLALGIKGVLSVNDPEFLLSPERFAYHRTALSGRINLKEDGRLKEWLQDGSSSVAFDLTFSFNDRGVPVVKGQAHAELRTQCQRCCGSMLLPLSFIIHLQLMKIGSQSSQGLGDDDVLTFTGHTLPLKELIEEEIILNMPMTPRHAENACQQKTSVNGQHEE